VRGALGLAQAGLEVRVGGGEEGFEGGFVDGFAGAEFDVAHVLAGALEEAGGVGQR